MPQTSTMLLPNSYTYMPQDVQDCRLPGLKPSKRFRRPPRQQLLQLLHAPAICFFRGFKTAVCPPSNPPNASNAPAGLQGNNSYSYMPLPSVFQGVQDCRLPALKPPKRFQRSRRPPRQQLLQLPSVSYMPQTSTMLLPNSYTYMPQDVQDCRLPGLKPSKRFRRPPRQQLLHAPGRSRLPFARPQTLQTLPQASKATTLTATTCPCHLFLRGFKTAVCPPSNPPNASNAPAGLQGNNSYSYMPLPSVFQGVQDCRLPALKPPKRFQRSRRPPRQQLLQLPSVSYMPQTSTMLLPNSYTYMPPGTFKTAVCPASNPPNASAGLQGNNSYSYYMPLPSVFQGVQDCRLPAPQTPQTLPTLPQASKATTLTATCPCHLFFRGFKTAVCPPSNPPNASNAPAGLQGNNSYSYMSPNPPNASNPLAGLPGPAICFSGVQDCRLPALKPPKRFQRSRRPPRQQLLQLLHAPAICFSGGSRLPFARPQTPQTLPTLPQASKATTLTATCPCHLFFQGVQDCRLPALKPPKRFQRSRRPPRQQLLQLPSVSYMPETSTMLLPNSYTYMPQDVQDCRLPGLKPSKRFRRPPRQQLLQLLHAPAICFSGGSRLPFARPQTPPNASNAPAGLQGNNSYSYPLSATCPRHLPCSCRTLTPTCPRTFKTAVCPASNPPNASAGLQGNNSYSYMSSNPPNASNPLAGLQGNNSYSYMPLPSVFQGVQDCRLPALKPPKRFQCSRRPPRQQLLQLHAPAICFSGGSRLPFARPQTPQTIPTLPQASKATTLTATCPCHLFFRGFKTAVCPPSNPPNASNAPAGLQGNNSYSYMSLPSVFQGVQDCRRKHSYMPLPSVFHGVQDCRLPGLKPSKRFQPSRRPPRQQLLQLHAPAICFSGGSRLPFARPQTPQTLPTLPQASKATTLTATCPCHLFFRGSRLPSQAKAHATFARPQTLQTLSARLQGNNSYSYYMPLPSVFQGVQDCRLPSLKPPKRFQRSRRPPRQQLLQLHAPAICFSRGSRLPFARPQTSQTLLTLPQASKATTLTATLCQLHAPDIYHAPAELLHLHAPGRSRLPFARPQTLQTLPQASKATTLTCPRTFKTAVCPASNPPNASAGLPRQQLLQLLHAPAICFSGGSRLPFARPQTPQTLPTLPQASKATTLTATCPCHLFFRGFKTAVCPPSNPPNASNAPAGLQGNNSYSYPLSATCPRHLPCSCRTLTPTCPRTFKTAVCPASNPPNASAGLQGNNSYSYYMPLPSVFQGVQDCRLPALKPPKRFQRSRRPPRQQLLQLHAPAICFSGGSRLPFARPQTPQTLPTLPQASKATSLTATCPQTLQTLPTLSQASQALPSVFQGFKTAVCPPSNPPNASNAPAGLQGNNSYSYYMPLPSVFSGGSRLPFARPQTPQTLPTLPQASKATTLIATCPCPSVFQGVQDCRLPALKPPKRFQRFRRPPRQQLLQLPSVSYMPQTSTMLLPNSYTYMPQDGLPFARPQTLQTLPQASKATTLTATSMSLPSVFQGVQDCRLPALKPPKRFPTLPQASKATTLTATCPCHLFFRGFKTAVCPPSNPPNASNAPAGLQGNNSYSYMSPNPPNASNPLAGLPGPAICFSGVQDCRLPALKPPKRFQRSRRPPRQQLLQLHVLKPGPDRCLFSSGKALRLLRPNCCVGSACEPCITVSRMCVWSKWRKCCRLWAIKTVPRNLWHK